MRIIKTKGKVKLVKGYLWWKKTIRVFPGIAEANFWMKKNNVK